MSGGLEWKTDVCHFPGDIKMKERTFIAIKPDGVQRGLIGRGIGRIEDKGYKIIGLKMLSVTPQQALIHSYART